MEKCGLGDEDCAVRALSQVPRSTWQVSRSGKLTSAAGTTVAEMRNTTPPITSNHPLQYLFSFVGLYSPLFLFFPPTVVSDVAHLTGEDPRKPIQLCFMKKCCILEYRGFAAEIGKPLHLEYFLLPPATICNKSKTLSKTRLKQIC